VTTLEEVFLKVAEIGSVEEREADRALSRQLSTERQHSLDLTEPASIGKTNSLSANAAPFAHTPYSYSRDQALQGERAFFQVRLCSCHPCVPC
jgi:hypothetical protein